ncbi:hypothetical protein [Paenarthrobacter sp. NPDC057981]|uniref:hypothetical protein n=1 Tax=Paenarthrobacter sp. NPDC057981 TaxID=3346297 RepID=UPI0036DCE377
MSKPFVEDTVGHVVHFVERLDATGPAPQSLMLPEHLGVFGRLFFAVVNALATVGAGWAVYLLWTEETPGLWFNVLFTVVTAAIPLVLWIILLGSGVEAKSDVQREAEWEETRESARAWRGSVVARDIQLAEEGSVSSFDLTVALEDGSNVRGRWRPAKASSRLPLQPQVPGVGSDVLVWRVPGADSAPLIIQVIDPTIVQHRHS